MGVSARVRARNHLVLALPVCALLLSLALPARADTGGAQTQVNNAQQNLNSAQGQARANDNALAAAQAQLAAYNARLNALQTHIAQLDATITTDTKTLDAINANLAADRGRLAAYMRESYEHGGTEAAMVYIISAQNIAGVIQRKEQLDHVAGAVQDLVARINRESQQAAQTLAADRDARAQLASAEQQLATEQALVAVQTEQVQAADLAAHVVVNQAQAQLSQAQQALAQAQAEAAAQLAAERARSVVFNPVNGPVFTVDTDLTQPSGENAQTINTFLSGTAMAGLGASFMHAEQAYHVNARYFVAHAILESNWGSSAIAHDKHNLFGFGADDAHPYQDAATFPSFDACIQYVGQFVATNYLSPNGRYYHGPTLRGMNVDYASDPYWADKIARIANTIPLPQ
ncbi:MAG: glucosaminidase domain-containing protein [Steroidobacteraceae bacterium]